MWSWITDSRRRWWVGGAAALVVVAAVVVPVTVTAGGSGTPADHHAAAAGGGTTTTSIGTSGHRTTSTTGGRAPTVAPPPTSTTTTLPVSAAGTHGLAAAVQPGQALPAVPGLKAVREVDAIVQLPTTITPDEVQGLTHLPGITAVEEVDIGTVELAGTPLVTVGVDPGTFREFTPQVTAAQDQLWSYVAAGALVADYGSAADHQLSAGQAIPLTPAGGKLPPAVGWLGALATLGLPGIDLVVAHTYAAALGLTSSNGLLVSAPGVDPYGLQASLTGVLHGAGVELLRSQPAGA